MAKQKLRSKLKEQLSKVSQLELKNHSSALSRNLFELLTRLDSEHSICRLGVYTPLPGEPIWWEDLTSYQGFEFLLVDMQQNGGLGFYPLELEKIQQLGLCLELPDDLKKQEKTPEVLFVPGLGFNRNCERIGRGKGYFDRYLASFKGISIGVFFSKQEVENVFTEEHDQALDYIVTEKEIIFKEIR